MTERDYIISCLSYVKIATQCIREIPNETWNHCIDLKYDWTADLCRVYTEIKNVEETMQKYLDTVI